jgi:hypothetical protein
LSERLVEFRRHPDILELPNAPIIVLECVTVRISAALSDAHLCETLATDKNVIFHWPREGWIRKGGDKRDSMELQAEAGRYR